MRVTIHDIASAAGVSPSTVSRALSADGVVSQKTRDRVRDAATRLGYHPNRSAQGLITGRSRNIGLVVPDLRDPFFADVAKGAQARARMVDHEVFISDSDDDEALEMEAVAMLGRGVDGFLLCSPRSPDAAIARRCAPRTTVLLHRQIQGFASVTADVAGGMRQAIDHLRALGHRRIATVSGVHGLWSGQQGDAGLQQALSAYDLEQVALWGAPSQFDGGIAAADMLLGSGASAIITPTDIVALGVLSRLADRGVSVPNEISVVGVGDVMLAAMSTPQLTSVALPKARAAHVGVELLLRMLQDVTLEPEQIVLPAQLMVRGSTGVAPPG